MNLTSPLALSLFTILGLSLIGLPVALSMIGGSILWLFMKGLDMGTASEQLLNGMMSGQLLLAIPLFILAAEFMNTGSIMDKLLHFCNAIVGRFRGGLAYVCVLQAVIFASMSGSALADAAAVGKRVVGLIVAVAAVTLFGMALPATIKYVTFMKVESSSYLGVRLDILYSVYVVFAVAVIVRYAWAIITLVRGDPPTETAATEEVSGL